MSLAPPPGLYAGRVMHLRLRPVRHQFRYRVFSLFLDPDHLERDLSGLRLLRLNRFGLLSYHDKDHGPRDGSPLRPWIDEEHAKRGLARPAAVRILCFPRILGYVFNPLTLYYGYDAEGRLTSMLYEVKNTFGDQVVYLQPCAADADLIEHSQSKGMYVSPFIEMGQTYAFRLTPPGETLALRIRQSGAEGETLISTLNGNRKALSDAGLIRQWLAHPLMTFKVMAAIHFEALRLWRKGVRFNRYSRSEIFAGEDRKA